MKRRNFLATMAGVATLAALRPALGVNPSSKTLMVVQLDGGNDGLNTFIPYNDFNYYKLRPTLGLKYNIRITDEVALHPAMADLKPLFNEGRLAVIQNVSYPKPDLSHFRSRDIWMSAEREGTPDSGWIARYLKTLQAQTADAIYLGNEYPLTLVGNNGEQYLHLSPGLSVQLSGRLEKAVLDLYDIPQTNPNIEQLRLAVVANREAIDEVAKDLSTRSERNGYPNTEIGNQFALGGAILESQPKVLYLKIGGWDTHYDQLNRHQNLLQQVSQSLAALDYDLQSTGLRDNVLILIHSEFGRRPAQNGTGGTDHAHIPHPNCHNR
jgi:uncharacterized protein (DUF1501 family)